MSVVFHGIRTQGFHILSSISGRLNYLESLLCPESEMYGAVIITVFEND